MRKAGRTAGLLLLGLLLGACGHKAAPESPGPAVSEELERLVVLRAHQKEPDTVTFRAVLRVENGRERPIVLQRADYAVYLEGKEETHQVQQLGYTVEAGAETELSLEVPLHWPSDKEFTPRQGRVSGTLYYQGPQGTWFSLPFDERGTLTVKE